MNFSCQNKKGLRLFELCLLLLSIFEIAIASPLPQDSALVARDGDPITLDEFISFLQQEYPNTENYLFYSAESDEQCINFAGTNEDVQWHYYGDIFNPDSQPYKDTFGTRTGDVEDESKALATVATGDILVFGAVQWPTLGTDSGFALWEVPILHQRLTDGDISSIKHMQRDATAADQVLATEDADGVITYVNGQSGPNASGSFSDCSGTHDAPTCEQ